MAAASLGGVLRRVAGGQAEWNGENRGLLFYFFKTDVQCIFEWVESPLEYLPQLFLFFLPVLSHHFFLLSRRSWPR